MLFSSIPFVYQFLPLVLAVYFLSPARGRNAVLLLASLLFYFWGEPRCLPLLLGSTLSAYLHGLLIGRSRGSRWAKVLLLSSVVSSVGVLGYFKYADFFLSSINAVSGAALPLPSPVLPIGISFYTFQTLSYTIDVYRGEARVQTDPLQLATYVALFPQLIAGPIVRYTDVERALTQRTHTAQAVVSGLHRFVIGLAKKVLLADVLGELSRAVYTQQQASVAGLWLYAVSASLQLYFDFSGYSDMAIGLGRVFGFHFPENFRYPYLSGSIGEFWRRWHVSLGSWFRDYVYIPLGGNRVSRLRWLRNVLIVWLLTGLWHGAAWNFVVWGLYFAFFLVAERLLSGTPLRRAPRAIGHLYAVTVIVLGFVIFNAADLPTAAAELAAMLGAGGLPLCNAQTLYHLVGYGAVLLIGLVGCTPLPYRLLQRLHTLARARRRERSFVVAQCCGALVLLCLVTAYFVDGSFSPFLYFRF